MNIKNIFCTLILMCIFTQGTPIYGQNELTKHNDSILSQVVVTANRYATRKRETGQIVNVISPQLFKNTMAVNPTGVLDFQPGARIEYNCSNCGVPQLRINGLGGEYTQVLLDSRPVFSSLSMVYGLEQLPAAMIERIETVRGGGSALFGSNAIAGTVNIITKEPVTSAAYISNQTGVMKGGNTDVTNSFNASIVSEDRKSGAYIFSMMRNRGTYDHNGDGFSELPMLRSQTIGSRMYHKFNSRTKLTGEYHHIHETRRGGDSIKLAPHQVSLCEQLEHHINGGGLTLDCKNENGNAFSLYSSAQHVNRSSYFGTGHNPDAYGRTQDLTVNAGGQYIHKFEFLWFMPSVFSVGADYLHNRLRDEMLGFGRIIRQETNVVGTYLQNEWNKKEWSVLLGARIDKHSLISSPILSPRVTLRHAPDSHWTLRTSYAMGYRAPQTYDEDLHVGAVGGEISLISLSKGLRPEYSNAINASASWWTETGNGWKIDALLEGFYTYLKNAFALTSNGHDAQGNLLLQRINSGGAYVAGINSEMRFTHRNKFSCNAGVTWQRSRYTMDFKWSDEVEPQRRMFRTPDVYAYLNLDYSPVRFWRCSVNGTYTGPMLLEHYSGYVERDCEKKTRAFLDLSFRLAHTFSLGSSLQPEIFVSCKNLLDQYQPDVDKGVLKDSKYIYGPVMPRSFYAGINIKF